MSYCTALLADQNISKKAIVSQLIKNFPAISEPQSLLECSKQAATGLSSQQAESVPKMESTPRATHN
jgi:hypothetical protein